MADSPPSGRRYAFVFVCQAGELEIKALLLAASLRRFLRQSHELIAAIPEPADVFGRVTSSTLRLLEGLGARPVPIANEIDPAYPIGNKVSCLRIPTDADKLVFLDSDMLCMRLVDDDARFGIALNAKPADNATFDPTAEAWEPLYALFGMPVPAIRVRSTVSGEYMPPYFNAGFVAVATNTAFGDLWLECCRQIRDSALPIRRRLLDQLGLAVAVCRSGLPFDCLDHRYNHPAHLIPLDARQPPFFCHYHWPAVIRREPSLLALVESLREEWPQLGSAMDGHAEWTTVRDRTRPRARWGWFSRRQSISVSTPDVLITGLPRSGTSYLCNVLHRFDDCVALNEPMEIFPPLMGQPIPWGLATFLRDMRRDVLEGKPIANKLRAGTVAEDTLGLEQRSTYTPRVSRPDFVLAVKNTVSFVNRLDALRRALPEAWIVACVRDPFATIASWKRSFAHLRTADVEKIPVGHVNDPLLAASQRLGLQAVASMPTDAVRRAAYWRYLAEQIRDHADGLVLVRYDDLVAQPLTVIRRILRGWSPGRLRESLDTSKRPSHLDLLDEEDVQSIRALCADVAADLGVYGQPRLASRSPARTSQIDSATTRSRPPEPVYFRSPRQPGARDVSDVFARSARVGAGKMDEFRSVEAYCMFVGYPRSGHSLVGSLLDAHPDVVIAHELDALGYLEAGFSAPQIYSLILEKDRAFTDGGREWAGYRYVVANQWQGRYRRLRVIGDKKGGASTLRLQQNPALLAELRRAVGIPVKIVHVVRNPYDNIATIFQRQEQPTLAASIGWYFSMCETVSTLVAARADPSVHTLRFEALVADPAATLLHLCRFVGVAPTADYLEDCAALVWKSPQKTRRSAGWTDDDIARVREQMRRFWYLEGYAFGD